MAGPCAAKTLVVVLLPGTSLADWQQADAPNLHEVMATGAVAVMNTRSARLPSDKVRETPESAALTLGAGARAAGGAEAADWQPEDAVVPGLGVSAGQIYERRTGLPAPPGAAIDPEWPRLLRENTGPDYDIRLGSLSDVLQRHGVRVEARGGPLAWALAADNNGVVGSPTHASGRDRCIVWDAGSNVVQADRRLGALLRRLADGRLIVLSPSVGDVAYARGERLSPIVVWGPGITPGLIYSPSTRRAGLVTNTDFAPSVADDFGLGLTAFPVRPFGNVWEYRPAKSAVTQAAALEAGAVRQWQGTKILPYLAVFLGIWMVCVTTFAGLHSVPIKASLLPALVILALLVSVSAVSFALWLGALVGLLLAARRLGVKLVAFLVTGTVAVLLAGDMLLGDPLMRLGLLGSSAIEGARYYGIGNEAMGPLVGACLVVADGLWPCLRMRQRFWLWGALVLVTALIGSPSAGAKAGGLIVALVAFGSFGWLRTGRQWDSRAALLASIGGCVVLLAVAFLDAHQAAGRQSHLGQAVARLMAGGAGEWRDIAARKLAVEGRLLWHSAWACPLWGGLGCLLWLTRQCSGSERPFAVSGLIAVAVCLAVNDAGAEAAAFCLSLVWVWLMSERTEKARRLTEQAAG